MASSVAAEPAVFSDKVVGDADKSANKKRTKA
jgi:hypothetical protein